MSSNRIVGFFFKRFYHAKTRYMDECMHSFNVNMQSANANSEKLNTKYFQQRSNSINSKRLQETHSQNRTYDLDIWPQAWSKRNLRGRLDWYWCRCFHFPYVVRPPHASLSPKIRLRFKVCELCSSMSVVTHSFCSTNIRSKPWAESRSVFFSCSPFGSYDHFFNLSVVDEELTSFFRTLATGTFSFGIAAFLGMASLGASFSCLVILAFALDEFSTSIGPFNSSNFSLPSWIKFWTLFLKIVQSSIEWPGTPEW